MLIPIALAIVALVTAFLLLFILAGQTSINTVTPILVSMIGLGVGIDYSLFIVTRFRQLLHEGLLAADAAAEAGASAGRAVIFAGLTVAISVAGLAFIGLDFVTKLGIGSSLGVLTTVLIANSLLIAVLALIGHKIDRLKVPFIRPVDDSEEARDKTLVARWGRFVTANAKIVFPVLLIGGFILAGTSGLVRLGAADQGTQPLEQTSRRAYDLLAEGFGAGFNGPIPIVVDVNGDKQAPQRIYDGVQGARRTWRPSRSRSSTSRTPSRSSSSPRRRRRRTRRPTTWSTGCEATWCRRRSRAVTQWRTSPARRPPSRTSPTRSSTGCRSSCSSSSASRSSSSRWRSARSSSPLTAAITTLLSAFIGFGVLGLVVQQGHFLGLTGLDKTGPIETFVPPIAFAILFGLSMDYMVFIMSRIREEHVHGLDTRAAVEHGISAIGRVVVAAALIMGTVFAAFILSVDRVPKEFGLLLAIAILTDALVVRMTLVPAFLTLMGEKSWYMPRWLDRVLPNITIEPPHDGEAPLAVEPMPEPEPTGGS